MEASPAQARPHWPARFIFVLLAMLLAAACLALLVPFYLASVVTLESIAAWFGPAHWSAPPAASDWVALLSSTLSTPFSGHHLGAAGSALMVVLVSLFLGVTADYAFGGTPIQRRLCTVLVLGGSLLPQVVLLSGVFELARRVQVYNHWWGLSMPYLIFTLPFAVWAALTFVRRLQGTQGADPGGGRGPAVLRAFGPMAAAALLTTAGLGFIAAWNELMFSVTFVLDITQRSKPLSAALVVSRARATEAALLVALAVAVFGIARWRKKVSGSAEPA